MRSTGTRRGLAITFQYYAEREYAKYDDLIGLHGKLSRFHSERHSLLFILPLTGLRYLEAMTHGS
jgi:hypothetical protein